MRILAWFSCGAASALATKLAIEKYGDVVEVLYCDTLAYEHPDNRRFLADCERWFGRTIRLLKSPKYEDIFDVFYKTRWLVGPKGARCTTELKKNVRKAYQRPGDVQIFGLTVEEKVRIQRFENENPEVTAEFPLIEHAKTKSDCLRALNEAAIELPAMYRLGYKNNNCIGCVKGQQGYWNKIRVDFPEAFERMARTERDLGAAINKKYVKGERIRIFLDELPPGAGRYDSEPDIECGTMCVNEARDYATSNEKE